MNAVVQRSLPHLRPMSDGDVAQVMAIEERVYPSGWTSGIFHDCLRVGYCCWVWEQGGAVVGYGIMSVAAGEAHVLNLCVAPSLQGQGLGRGMLEHLLDLARVHGAGTAILEVRPSNRVAVALYRGAGFEEVGRRRGYYPDPQGREDALVFSCAL